ncbi:MAG TPA: flagella basal body P-ring formation protein FlgA [Pseudohongiella sp.]|nr:flagella basal body P-ring formation protein FlgA [Pseudohongiella sp.]MAY56034.1 flagella basal body P-ring formation protein FlgA [Gammaproteobacteria bacterium]MBJ54358.1 flagella basal body P-ring formation protein FlgA [Gammaproteobacteria bacterium]MBJ54831.1 flagella basal body P-ring formation protein FlgA [Gammaproteobacteria bacterium]HBN14428.1 flagella basal body P-ring formation protein FlgA [Pseudohongiella sp.]
MHAIPTLTAPLSPAMLSGMFFAFFTKEINNRPISAYSWPSMTKKRQGFDSMKLVSTNIFSHTAVINAVARHLFAAMMLLWVPVSALAQTSSGAQQLLDAAYQALQSNWSDQGDRVEIEMASIDPRLQIPVCQVPLESSLNSLGSGNTGGRVTVRVSCSDNAPWTRHVAAQVKVYREIAVSSRALERGARINPPDVVLEERDVSQIRGQILESTEPVVGQVLRRSLRPGDALTLDILEAPTLVRRGDTVVLTASRGSVSIRHTGTAMQDGQQGRQIPVRNDRSGRVVQAIVIAEGEAEVVF